MEEHWHAFSFVDRIASLQPGARIYGSYTVPAQVDRFPLSLAGEAIGQLAAWAAMAAVDFLCRPVAGIAGRVELLKEVRPGQLLELIADLETVDTEAASYSGCACVDGVPVIRLEHCVGPMLPVAELDDPDAVRNRFTLLCDSGATPGVFPGLPALLPERDGGELGQTARAALAVPAQAPFFGDHFPRRPVFPGSLLLDATLMLATFLANELPPPAGSQGWRVKGVSDVKFRVFIPPGGQLELSARRADLSETTGCLVVEARSGGRLTGAARVQIVAG